MTRVNASRRSGLRLLGGLAAASLTAACVTASEFRALERDVARLKERRVAPAAQGGSGDVRVADLGAQVDALEREVARLRGAVEESRHEAEQARETANRAFQAAQAGSEPQSSAGQPSAGEPSTGQPVTSANANPAPGPVVTSLPQEVRDYEEGFALYRAAQYEAAIDHFRAFLQNYPSSPYADNALFWIGESQFRLGDYERAVLTFEEVVKQYPDENKVPDALYRQGVALVELGRRKGEEEIYTPAAREIFERIVTEYPASTRVPEAQKQLEKLSR